MQIPIEQLAAFAEGPFTGNPAAVCVLDQWLPDALLQAIATELNLSETAFVRRGTEHHDLRWFTPRCEVDLCGHATLAAAQVMFGLAPERKALHFDTRSGALQVMRNGSPDNASLNNSPLLTLDFPVQQSEPCTAPDALIQGLGRVPESCYRGADWMAVLASEAEIRALAPDLQALEQLDGRGVIVTAPGEHVDLVSRFFAPKIGIPEDPVTGSAHCSLVPYWAQRLGKQSLHARQLSARGGTLHCQMHGTRVIVTAPGDHVDLVSRFFAPKIGIPEDPVTGSAHCSLVPYWAQRLGKQSLHARQLSARGGTLHCQMHGTRVRLSGRVVPFLRGTLHLPDSVT